jgi:hypothetical protein
MKGATAMAGADDTIEAHHSHPHYIIMIITERSIAVKVLV